MADGKFWRQTYPGTSLERLRERTGGIGGEPVEPEILKVKRPVKPVRKVLPIKPSKIQERVISGLPIREEEKIIPERERFLTEEEKKAIIKKPGIKEIKDIKEIEVIQQPIITREGEPIQPQLTRRVLGGGEREFIIVSEEEIMRRAKNGIEISEGVFFGGGAVSQPEVFISKGTGRTSGVTLPDGRTFLGLSPEDAVSIAEGVGVGVGGIIGVGEGARQRAVEREQARIVQEEAPVRRGLEPEPVDFLGRPVAEIPVAGGVLGAIRNMVYQEIERGLVPDWSARKKERVLLSPEDLRTEALTQIEKKVFKEGVTSSEQFGAFIEGIPVAGALVSQYVSGLIETPYGNIQEMRKNIKKETTRATNLMTLSRSGEIPPELARLQITDIEDEIQRLESRIKLLINFSPQLRFNSDQINTIETEILRSREILFEAKLRASQGGITPVNDMQLASTLQDLSGISLE